MAQPNKATIDSIKKCLDDLANLSGQVQNTKLPDDIRKRGKAILNRVFNPDNIAPIDVKTLNEELKLINELKQQYDNLNFYRLLNYAREYPDEIEKLYKYSLGQMSLVTTEEHEAFKVQQRLTEEKDWKIISELTVKKKKRVVISKTMAKDGSISTTKNTTYLKPNSGGIDASPNPYFARDHGRYGSHPMHDGFDDESNP